MARSSAVLFATASTEIGGGTRVLMNVILRLPSHLRAIVVAPGEGAVTEWARTHDVPYRIVRSSKGAQTAGRITMVRQAAALVPIILSESVKVLHAESPVCYRPVGLAAALTRRPSVCHLGFPPTRGELEWNFRYGPDVVVACYDGQARLVDPELKRVRPTAAMVSVPNGIDLTFFRPTSDVERTANRWRFGARHVVLIVGHLSHVKGYPTFLEAAARINRSLEDCVFVSVGGETIQRGFGTELKRQARELGIASRTHFLGWHDDISSVLQAADVMVLPSMDEGLPMAILEAMAAGLPVVSTPVGGVPDAVVPGTTGLLVPPQDPRALAEAVLTLLRNPAARRTMGEAGRQRAEQYFSLDRCASEMVGVYDRLIA